jgi:hypothetical protein
MDTWANIEAMCANASSEVSQFDYNNPTIDCADVICKWIRNIEKMLGNPKNPDEIHWIETNWMTWFPPDTAPTEHTWFFFREAELYTKSCGGNWPPLHHS